jgi:hypothetical protein
VLGDGVDDHPERLHRRFAAVDEQERLAVVGADTDLETAFLRVRVAHGPTYLETLDLADEDAVLDDHRGTTLFDELGEVNQCGVHVRGARKRFRLCSNEAAPVDTPHLGRYGEVRRTPCEQAGGGLSQYVQSGRFVLPCPGKGPAEGTLRIVLGKDPRFALTDECGPTRPDTGTHGSIGPEVLAHEGSQFETEELAAPRRIGAGH